MTKVVLQKNVPRTFPLMSRLHGFDVTKEAKSVLEDVEDLSDRRDVEGKYSGVSDSCNESDGDVHCKVQCTSDGNKVVIMNNSLRNGNNVDINSSDDDIDSETGSELDCADEVEEDEEVRGRVQGDSSKHGTPNRMYAVHGKILTTAIRRIVDERGESARSDVDRESFEKNGRSVYFVSDNEQSTPIDKAVPDESTSPNMNSEALIDSPVVSSSSLPKKTKLVAKRRIGGSDGDLILQHFHRCDAILSCILRELYYLCHDLPFITSLALLPSSIYHLI